MNLILVEMTNPIRMKLKNVLIQWRHLSHHSKPISFSHIFQTCEPVPKEKSTTPTACKSIKLMLNQGLISPASSGIFSLMPLGVRSLEKLCHLIDLFMKDVNGQKIILPSLTLGTLWKKSGRWNSIADLFKLKDRHSTDYCLGPTHEEAVTRILTTMKLSYKSLPLRLYQISSKFRDELHPKLGLLRGREFIMKDMYTFDVSEENSRITYEEICSAYMSLFNLLEVDYYKVKGSTGDMGGSHSHEFHFLSDVGEDEVLVCKRCKTGYNVEVTNTQTSCEHCGSQLERQTGIEVGHAFLLGQSYTKLFEAKFRTAEREPKILEMGCYGLGVSRILAACVECLSTPSNIQWPLLISPFLVSVIPPKKGSKEEAAQHFGRHLSESLCEIDLLSDNVIWDDRTNFTIGKRVQDAATLGIPFAVVSGSKVLEDIPKIEVIDLYRNETLMMTHKEVISFFTKISEDLCHRVTSSVRNIK